MNWFDYLGREWTRDHIQWSYSAVPVQSDTCLQKANWYVTDGSSQWSGTNFDSMNVHIKVLSTWPVGVSVPLQCLDHSFWSFQSEIEQRLRDKQDFDDYHTAKRREEEERVAAERRKHEERAATTIQKHWREAVSNPYRPVCQRRMWREFMDMRFEDCDRCVA